MANGGLRLPKPNAYHNRPATEHSNARRRSSRPVNGLRRCGGGAQGSSAKNVPRVGNKSPALRCEADCLAFPHDLPLPARLSLKRVGPSRPIARGLPVRVFWHICWSQICDHFAALTSVRDLSAGQRVRSANRSQRVPDWVGPFHGRCWNPWPTYRPSWCAPDQPSLLTIPPSKCRPRGKTKGPNARLWSYVRDETPWRGQAARLWRGIVQAWDRQGGAPVTICPG